MRRFFTFKHVFIILLAVIFGNLLILNIFFLNNAKIQKQNAEISSYKNSVDNIVKDVSKNTTNDTCSTNCTDKIDEASKSINIPTVTQSKNNVPSTPTQKEYFISLGTGSSQATEWSNVSGAEVEINGNAYTNIKQVTFQVSLHTPTANQIAWARLYNLTDKRPVWNSEVSIEGGTPKLLISEPISLERGTKIYQVQMKTQLGSTTNLAQSRIHISIY